MGSDSLLTKMDWDKFRLWEEQKELGRAEETDSTENQSKRKLKI